MKTLVKHLFTQNDNQTWDIKAILTTILVLGLIIAALYYVYNGGHFSPMDFGIGGGSLISGYGIGRKLDIDPTVSEDLSGKEKP